MLSASGNRMRTQIQEMAVLSDRQAKIRPRKLHRRQVQAQPQAQPQSAQAVATMRLLREIREEEVEDEMALQRSVVSPSNRISRGAFVARLLMHVLEFQYVLNTAGEERNACVETAVEIMRCAAREISAEMPVRNMLPVVVPRERFVAIREMICVTREVDAFYRSYQHLGYAASCALYSLCSRALRTRSVLNARDLYAAPDCVMPSATGVPPSEAVKCEHEGCRLAHLWALWRAMPVPPAIPQLTDRPTKKIKN